jgi:predicted Fe-S protein YdhL (DUF1289 family)
MSRFPIIDSPCPYKDNLSSVMDGDFCRKCERQVTDLSAMAEGERLAFLSACEGEVCVSYIFPKKKVMTMAALAIAAASFPSALAAQEVASDFETEDMMIIVGGLRAPEHAKMVDDAADDALPTLPVIIEPETLRPGEPLPAPVAR